MAGKVVCVTGGGGYVASWLVKLLLSQGYSVHATLRYPQDEKNAHLKKLGRASENLQLFKVDLLDFDSLSAAINGCDSVFHVASPVPSTILELMEPAVKGTLNVLKASSEADVKRVVFVSSIAAVVMNPSWPTGQLMDETCWSDKEYCRNTNSWYCLSKTEAESEAWEFAKTSGLDVVTVCPSFVFGPILQSTPNSSSLILINLLKEGHEEGENKSYSYVDVCDLAEALILVNEKPEANGRYICAADVIKVQDMVEILRRIYPDYNYPRKYIEIEGDGKVTSLKLQKLGWSCKGLEETLKYIAKGLEITVVSILCVQNEPFYYYIVCSEVSLLLYNTLETLLYEGLYCIPRVGFSLNTASDVPPAYRDGRPVFDFM